MKKICLSMATAALMLSGCASMVYGNRTAPVTSLNQGQTPLQPQGSIRRVPVQPGQTAAVTPNRVVPQPVRPAPVRPQQPVVAQPSYPSAPNGGVQVIAQSPYGAPAVATPVADPYQPRPQAQPYPQQNSNDGWAVSPQPAQASQAGNTAPTVSDEPKPVRPGSSESSTSTADAASPTRPATDTAATQAPASTQDQVAAVAAKPPAESSSQGDTAVSVLLKKASASLGKGDLDGAAAYLENAQRIEPQNAKILYDIANIRYHQGRYKDAENFAAQATSKNGSSAMMKKSWALIANSRKQLGDNQGAIAAAEKAASFGN